MRRNSDRDLLVFVLVVLVLGCIGPCLGWLWSL